MIANIAIPGTIGIIRQGITEVLKSLKKKEAKNLGTITHSRKFL